MERVVHRFGRNIKIKQMEKKFYVIGALLLASGIILGAFGAHGLEGKILPENIDSYEVGVRFQMYHGLAFLILGTIVRRVDFSMKSVLGLLLVGTVLFSVSIYFLSIQSMLGMSLKFLGPITPLGGSLMIVGWVVFLVNLLRNPLKHSE